MLGRVSDIDIRLLRVFVAVVDSGGFSLAVPRLNVAESTVSQHMSDLEKRVGMRLCERGRGGFSVTRDGEQVYARAVELLDQLEQFRDGLSSIKTDLSGTLRLGMTDGLVTETRFNIGKRLADYAAANPSIKLEIKIRSPRWLERSVYEGDIDIAIGAEHRRVSGLSFTDLFQERNNLYCGASHPLFAVPDGRISTQDIAGLKRIARGYLDRFDEQFFAEQSYAATVHQIEAAAMLILHGPFVGFLPEHYAREHVAAGTLRALRADHYTFSSRFGLLARNDGADDPRCRSLAGFLTT